MISWIVIAIIFALCFILIRINHYKHKFTLILLLIFALFIYSTAMVVHTTNDLDFTTTEGFFNAVKIYIGWLGNSFQNLRVITTNAVKMDWTSTNGTFSIEEIKSIKK